VSSSSFREKGQSRRPDSTRPRESKAGRGGDTGKLPGRKVRHRYREEGKRLDTILTKVHMYLNNPRVSEQEKVPITAWGPRYVLVTGENVKWSRMKRNKPVSSSNEAQKRRGEVREGGRVQRMSKGQEDSALAC